MKRRSIFSLIFVIVVALTLASPVWAGGVIVSLDTTPTDVQAGVPFDVDFTVLSAHDGSDIAGLKPIVTATNEVTGEEITVTAIGDRKTGHYIARLTLPSEGEWQWGIQPFGVQETRESTRMMTALQVAAPRDVSPVTVDTTAPGANAIAFDATALPAIALIVVTAAVAALGLIRMRRRAVAR